MGCRKGKRICVCWLCTDDARRWWQTLNAKLKENENWHWLMQYGYGSLIKSSQSLCLSMCVCARVCSSLNFTLFGERVCVCVRRAEQRCTEKGWIEIVFDGFVWATMLLCTRWQTDTAWTWPGTHSTHYYIHKSYRFRFSRQPFILCLRSYANMSTVSNRPTVPGPSTSIWMMTWNNF